MGRIARKILVWIESWFVDPKKVVAFVNDAPRRGEFVCRCGRRQKYAVEGDKGGVTEKEAEWIGWRKIDGWWTCPFCTGNTDNLNRIWGK